jgi:membrane dipeptidase
MRLNDLHCNWLWQYATETTLFDSALYADIPAQLNQLDGYLLGTAAAVLACGRKPGDRERDGDRWSARSELIARCEAEFSGRLLIGRDDVTRWRSRPADGLCWGVLGIAGFDDLVREPADLDRLPGLFARGVRVFQLVTSAGTALAGSSERGDDRGLTELGRAFLERLLEAASIEATGPRPVVDLAGLNRHSMAEVLDWFEKELARTARVLTIYSHGAVRHAGFDAPFALDRDNLARLRAIGGTIGFSPGLPYYGSPEELKAGIEAAAEVPWQGQPGFAGLAIGTDFLGLRECIPSLANVVQLTGWIGRNFDRPAAEALIAGTGERLFMQAAGQACL